MATNTLHPESAPATGSDPVAAAWQRARNIYVAFEADLNPLDDVDANEIVKPADIEEQFMRDHASTSLEGVEAKLRSVFRSMMREASTCDAALGVSNPKFEHDLHLADFYEQMLWSAIRDIAALRGARAA